MYFLYITLLLMLVAVALWAIVCFHYVLQQQRVLNLCWQRLHDLWRERDDLFDYLLQLSRDENGITLPVADAFLKLLDEDAQLDWQDVPARAQRRNHIDEQARLLIAQLGQRENIRQHEEFPEIMRRLGETQTLIGKHIERYNRAVKNYNFLLRQNPNRFFAARLGLTEVAPYRA